MMNYLNTYRRYACDINRVNREALNDPEGFVCMTENVFRYDLGLIAEQVLNTPAKRHVILLSGPSSSGKTTSALKLSDEFGRHGVDVNHISMDDFYLGKDFVKKLPDGKPDFESVDALDIPMIKQTITDLTEKGEAIIPQYDFGCSARKTETKHISTSGDSVIIIEGIHALNPIFSEGMSKESVMKIYVSVKQGIKENEDYVLTNREIRFIRRLIRDRNFRNTEPEYLLILWDSIVDGEMKYIRPYRYTSDFTINSIHIYEPCVFRNIALETLKNIKCDEKYRSFINKLITSLERFQSIDSRFVPDDSLIREFIGGGCYSY